MQGLFRSSSLFSVVHCSVLENSWCWLFQDSCLVLFHLALVATPLCKSWFVLVCVGGLCTVRVELWALRFSSILLCSTLGGCVAKLA